MAIEARIMPRAVVIRKTIERRITWEQAASSCRGTDWHLRRLRERYELYQIDGRRERPSCGSRGEKRQHDKDHRRGQLAGYFSGSPSTRTISGSSRTLSKSGSRRASLRYLGSRARAFVMEATACLWLPSKECMQPTL